MLSDGYPPLIENIDWKDVFLNEMPPTKLDIGCGRGLLTLTIADNEPQTNILGIEVRSWCCEWLDNYIRSERIENCGILRYNVGNGLHFIAPNSIDAAFYLFPDPWVKVKHIKRRAYNITLLTEIERILKTDGRLYLATDILDVHQYHIDVLNEFGKFNLFEVTDDSQWNIPQTNKEIFCRKEGIPFYRIIASRNVMA
jgi:tRNA (guanine-N7-)-methyltransferase